MTDPTPITELAAKWRKRIESRHVPYKIELDMLAELEASLAAIPDVNELAEAAMHGWFEEWSLEPASNPDVDASLKRHITAALQQVTKVSETTHE